MTKFPQDVKLGKLHVSILRTKNLKREHAPRLPDALRFFKKAWCENPDLSLDWISSLDQGHTVGLSERWGEELLQSKLKTYSSACTMQR